MKFPEIDSEIVNAIKDVMEYRAGNITASVNINTNFDLNYQEMRSFGGASAMMPGRMELTKTIEMSFVEHDTSKAIEEPQATVNGIRIIPSEHGIEFAGHFFTNDQIPEIWEALRRTFGIRSWKV